MNGLTNEQTELNRQGLANDAKVQVGLQLAQSITKNRGKITSQEIEAAKAVGYNDGDILEIY